MDKLILTNDGSHSVESSHYKVSYHSKFGAITESMHVFIDAGLRELWPTAGPRISILEIGLGTGLNVLLTQKITSGKTPVYYSAIEAFPLSERIVHQLNYATALDINPSLLPAIHSCEWASYQEIAPNFHLKKILTKLESWQPDELFDLIYFDAFAPTIQPELWTEAIFQKLFDALSENGIIVTYSAKGAVRRAMMAAGFVMEKLPGPPGKREMLRGRKKKGD